MRPKNPVFTETLPVLIGQLICVPLMIGVFYLLGHYDRSVLWGGILGGSLMVFNFFLMAVGTSIASDRAEEQNVKGGKAVLTISRFFRYGLIILVFFIAKKSELFHLLATALPFVFQWPILILAEFFRKAGKNKT